MKVFVYTKDAEAKKIAVITRVVKVEHEKDNDKIVFEVENGAIFEFDTRLIKCTIYQN